ncbi:hypothetical protein ACFWBG_30535 [Nocardia salmonicida]|uniref:hypothetical protein n=1 Tax=Nocardia salmonicida TaxID=53431 RepID=UPI0036732258
MINSAAERLISAPSVMLAASDPGQRATFDDCCSRQVVARSSCWLPAEWSTGAPEPTEYWLSTLPVAVPLRNLARRAKIRWHLEHDYRELKDGLGLDHFEGRSSIGWRRHFTLASVAQAICTQLRHTRKALRSPDPPRRPAPGFNRCFATWTGQCPHLPPTSPHPDTIAQT